MREKPKVSIYYDKNCLFCRRSVELIVRWFFVRTQVVVPAQDDVEIYSLMQKYDSWVVVNEKGIAFTTFNAGVEVARHSPILMFLVPLAKPRFMQRFGEWTYRKIAQNRAHIPLP
jgi:predicted DCC family thiol-disulfide oxidoreductase YuxK